MRAVGRYLVTFTPTGTTTPTVIWDVGCPDLTSTGEIVIDLARWVLLWPVIPGTAYDVRIVASGPYGETASPPGGPVLFTAAALCSYVLSPAAPWTPAPSGAMLSVLVTPTPSTCAWRVSTPAWVIPSLSVSTGKKTITLTAAPNHDPLWRSGHIAVGDYRTTDLLVYQNVFSTDTLPTAPASVTIRP